MINNCNVFRRLLFSYFGILGVFIEQQNEMPANQVSEKAATNLSIQEILLNEVVLNSSALSGLPTDYQLRTKEYFEKVIERTEGQGKWPKRNSYSLIKLEGIQNRKLSHSEKFPQAVRIKETKSVPIELLILPDPKMVRAFGTVELDFAELARQQPVKHPEEWQRSPEGHAHTVKTNVYCVPISLRNEKGELEAEDSQIILPRPRGTKPRNDGGLSSICEYQSVCSYEEFLKFPELDSDKEKEIWQGIMASGSVFENNPIVRWVSLRTPAEPQIKTWVAYAVIDACGALPEGNGNMAGYGGITYFLPPLRGPFAPTLKMNEQGLRSKLPDPPSELRLPRIPTEFNLLRIPAPNKGEYPQWNGADWSLCEEYYSEHKTPAWKLTITNDSKPYRETFCIEHGLDDSDQEIWKLIVFATIKPKDLLQVICKLKGIDATEIPIGELETAYNELTAVREKLLKK